MGASNRRTRRAQERGESVTCDQANEVPSRHEKKDAWSQVRGLWKVSSRAPHLHSPSFVAVAPHHKSNTWNWLRFSYSFSAILRHFSLLRQTTILTLSVLFSRTVLSRNFELCIYFVLAVIAYIAKSFRVLINELI